ncbi:hypothetical protein F5Y01DRAFT_281143 [Xylaria sp. FL0043]|nr:hypothetical protein F5Y01DRAFT_281143 [Xylaria sp. FL0043]
MTGKSVPQPTASRRTPFPTDLLSSEFGSIQSTPSTHDCFDCLFITEDNVESLLTLCEDPNYSLRQSPNHARYLIDCLQRDDELIVTSQHVLDEMEYMWTGRKRAFNSQFQSASEIEIYAILEYRCFIDQAWNICRQLTCLSVSKSAYKLLMKAASTKKYQPKQLSNVSRGCPSTAIYEAIECLLSGSPLQVVQSAITGTMLSIRPRLVDSSTVRSASPIQTLHFHTRSQSWIRQIVNKYSSMAKKRPPKEMSRSGLVSQLRRKRKYTTNEDWLSEYRRRTNDRSFERISNRTVHNVNKAHDSWSCRRCTRHHETRCVSCAAPWKSINMPASARNTLLVQGERTDTIGKRAWQRHNFCLFMLGDGPILSKDVTGLADVIKAHLEIDRIYRTILQTPELSQQQSDITEGPRRDERNLHNAPLAYKPLTDKEYIGLRDWLMALQRKHVPPKRKNTAEDENQAKRGRFT